MQVNAAVLKPYMPFMAFGAFAFILVFILMKLIQSRGGKKSSSREAAASALHPTRENLVKSGKKKRGKKQRPTDISGHQKPIARSEIEKSIQTNQKSKASTPTLENGDAKIKKLDKKKNKGKKRKNHVEDESLTPYIENQATIEEAGEWHTVVGKEQRTKREKKKAVDVEPAAPPSVEVVKPAYVPPYVPPSLPSTAKDVAPRFAKQAGEEWTEKRPSSNHQPSPKPTISRTPISQAALPPTKTVTSWLPTTSIPGLWESDTNLISTSLSSIEQTSWNQTNESTFPKPSNSSSTWVNQASTAVTSHRWGSGSPITDDWVHVSSASSSYQPSPLRQWSGIRTGTHSSPPVVAQEMMKREEFLLEPEGYSVTTPDDPWNPDNFDKADDGDWEAPGATWTNTNDEWETPRVENKPKPSYFDESSEEERAPVTSQIPSQSSSVPQSVVGAGPDLITPANQNVNKKQRRRRKKKNITPQDSTNGTDNEVASKDNEIIPEQTENNEVKITQEILPSEQQASSGDADWSKAGKKKKSRSRKED